MFEINIRLCPTTYLLVLEDETSVRYIHIHVKINHNQAVKPTKLDMPFLVIACMHVFWYQLMKLVEIIVCTV